MATRPFHRRFGTRRLFAARGPRRYVMLTPLGADLTRDGGRPVLIEHRAADRTQSRPAGWYVEAPPWQPVSYDTAREAAQQAAQRVWDYDLQYEPGLAPV